MFVGKVSAIMEVTRTKPFPKGEEDFKNDDRICFDTADNLYVLEDEDGKQYEWLSAHSAWVEKVRFIISLLLISSETPSIP